MRQLSRDVGEFLYFTFDPLDLLVLFGCGKLLILLQRYNFAVQTLGFPSEALLFCLLCLRASLVLIDVLLELGQIIIESTKACSFTVQHGLSGLDIAFELLRLRLFLLLIVLQRRHMLAALSQPCFIGRWAVTE